MLKLKNVSKFYYSKGVIASGFTKVNLEFKIGEFIAITGESGSGKSTLLNVLSGLDTYEEGEMYINGKETSHYIDKDWEEYRRKHIGNIYQNFNLVNSYTVYQNIELSLTLNGISRKERKRKVLELIKQVGLMKFKNTKVSKLSGGQKQRVAIARALAKDVPIILADEPTASLDKKASLEIIKILSEISKEKLVIIVTHNYEQTEPYVTRKITMHDGKVIEDKKIKQVEEVTDYQPASLKNIKFFDKIWLGLRNTFNLIPKFILLLLVYIFIVAALVGEYSSFRRQEYLSNKEGWNTFFMDTTDTRIILKKQDKTSFTKEELESLKNKKEVDYLLEHDLLVDINTSMTSEVNGLWVNGILKNIETFKGNLDHGRKPEKDNEIIITGMKDDYYLKERWQELLNETFYLVNSQTGEVDKTSPIKVVGIKLLDNYTYQDYSLYFSDTYQKKMLFQTNSNYSKVIINFMGKNYASTESLDGFQISTSDKVPVGESFISKDLNVYCEKENCLNKNFTLNVSNIYYTDTYNFKIVKTYDKKNIASLLGLKDYNQKDFQNYHNGKIYINPEDYLKLFNKDTFQISVYAKDYKQVDSLVASLKKSGYEPLVVKDTLIRNGDTELIRIVKIVITLALVITLFFISYFIIRLILKSRSGYFSVTRMLGANKRTCRDLLIIELLTVANLAYFLFVLVAVLEKINILNFAFLKTVNEYFLLNDYLILYLIISLMSIFISFKYSRKIFSVSVMNAYRKEV